MKKQLVVGHRGALGLAPENTIRAHQVAYDVGAHMVEIDVQETLDGKLVCIHDYDVDRTTNGSGAIAKLSYHEIQEFDAGSGEKIPTLDEVLDFVRGKMKINIELKVTDIEKEVLVAVKERDMVSDVMISSFLHGTLDTIRTIDRAVSTAVLVTEIRNEIISYVVEHEANALNPFYNSITLDIITEAHSNNIQIFPWTVNDSAQMQVLYKMGVDGIITDFPEVAIKILEKISNY